MEFMGKWQIANIWKHYGDKFGRSKMGESKRFGVCRHQFLLLAVAFVYIVLAMIPINY